MSAENEASQARDGEVEVEGKGGEDENANLLDEVAQVRRAFYGGVALRDEGEEEDADRPVIVNREILQEKAENIRIAFYVLGILVFYSTYYLDIFWPLAAQPITDQRAFMTSLSFGMVVYAMTGNTSLLSPPSGTRSVNGPVTLARPARSNNEVEVIPLPQDLRIFGFMLGLSNLVFFILIVPRLSPVASQRKSDEAAFVSFSLYLLCGPIPFVTNP